MFYPESKMREVIARYKKDQPAQIYYNPDNPVQSVLVTGFAFWAFVGGMVLGLLFSALGLWGLSRLWK